MKKEHRLFVVLLVKDKWYVFLNKEKKSPSFTKKKEAENYKSYLVSR